MSMTQFVLSKLGRLTTWDQCWIVSTKTFKLPMKLKLMQNNLFQIIITIIVIIHYLLFVDIEIVTVPIN